MGWIKAIAACAAICFVFSAGTARAQSDGESTPEPKTMVVVGDSLGACLHFGLYRELRGTQTYTLVDKSKVSSGLSRPDFYDWVAEAKTVSSDVKPDVAFVILGGNDIQALRNGKSWVDYGTPEWEKVYRSRIDAVTKTLKETADVFWVGMPIIRNEKLNAGTAFVNLLYKEQATKNGITFIPTRALTADENGNFRSHYKDSSGRTKKMRDDDGIHFTVPGCIHLAEHILGVAETAMSASQEARDD